ANAPGPQAISAFFWPVDDEGSLPREIISRLSDAVYVSVDLDVFDPSVMAAVGTPEPGGMSWNQVTGLLRAVAESRRIVGFDVCELAPREGPMACTYTAAKLVYKLIAYASRPPDSLSRFRG
ncbi:MAG: arginase family protein, partial [Stenotrophomonas maltophilia]